MNKRLVLRTIGRIGLILAGLLLIPLLVSLIYQDDCVVSFAVPILFLVVFGILTQRIEYKKGTYRSREGYAVVFASWILMSVAGAIPFVISGAIPSFVDALFESISGFTTTGSSILTEIQSLPESILFWRSFTHWIGGLGILMFMMAILPKTDRRSMYLLRAEVPGYKVEKLTTSLKKTVRILYGIYIGMTILLIILLMFGGMNLYDAMVHAFSTAGTGGFSNQNTSVAFYDSAYIDVVIGVFMMLFGVNYSLYYFLLLRRVRDVAKDEELRTYVGIIAISTILIAVNILPMYGNIWSSLRYSFFQVSSIITTTGFMTADYTLWPSFSQAILLLVMCVGACFGSTGGGIKVTRLILIFKQIKRELMRLIEPRSIITVRINGRPVDRSELNATNVFFMTYMAIITVSTLLLSLDNRDLLTTLTAVMTCINNVGPAFGQLGPTANFSEFSAFGKLLLSFNMLAGRLDVVPVLLLFQLRAWSKQ